MTSFDLTGRISEYGTNRWGALNSDLRKRKSHCFFPSFAPLPTWQPDKANHSVRWPFSAIATHPHTCHGAKFPQL